MNALLEVNDLKKHFPVRSGPLGLRAGKVYAVERQIKALREKRGLSQQEVAKRADTAQTIIARLEAGRCAIGPVRAVLDKSPNRLASPVRRLVIEATFTV